MKRIKTWESHSKINEGYIHGISDLSRKGLESLEGLGIPKSLNSYFTCEKNKLTSLKGGPEEVGFAFDCCNNELTSLEYGPKKVGKIYFCYSNRLTSLEGAPEEVETFMCDHNELKDLKGSPKIVEKGFTCTKNPLTSLQGAPEKIGEEFSCDYFVIRNGRWGIDEWIRILVEGDEKAKKLILTILTEDILDKWILEDPTRICNLDVTPDLKAGVIKRTGIKDLSRLGRGLKSGLV